MKITSLHHLWIPFRDCLAALLWLLCIVALNQQNFQITSVIPYLVPVVFITIRYGTSWGFVISALATISTVSGNDLSSLDRGVLFWGMSTTYLKLSCATAGIGLGRAIVTKR